MAGDGLGELRQADESDTLGEAQQEDQAVQDEQGGNPDADHGVLQSSLGGRSLWQPGRLLLVVSAYGHGDLPGPG
jgi:hypothetical protein